MHLLVCESGRVELVDLFDAVPDHQEESPVKGGSGSIVRGVIEAGFHVFTSDLTGSLSVFYNQVESIEDSPAHSEEYETAALKRVLVGDVMTRNVRSVTPLTRVDAVKDLMKKDLLGGFPVISDGRIVGMVTTTDMLKVERSKREETVVEDIMASQLVVAYPEEDLLAGVTRMMAKGVSRLPVVSHDAPDVMIGIITRSDIAKAIEQRGSHPKPRKTIHEQNT